jgi:hypothetical protein
MVYEYNKNGINNKKEVNFKIWFVENFYYRLKKHESDT